MCVVLSRVLCTNVAATVALLLLLPLPPPLPPPLLLLLRSTHLLPRCCASVSCSFLSSCSKSFRNCTHSRT